MIDGRVKIAPADRIAIFAIFTTRVEDGDTIPIALAAAGTTWASIGRWLADDRNVTATGETFSARYTRARSSSASAYADRAQRAAEDATPEDVQVKRLQADTYKWRAAMADPQGYSERRQLDVKQDTHLIVTVRRTTAALPSIAATATLANAAHDTELAQLEPGRIDTEAGA